MNNYSSNMNAEIMQKDSKSITLQVTIPLSDDMLSSEELIQQGVNLAGLLATEHSLSRFDTDGTPIKIPIGSGVVEAACKVIVKQRLCNSGMRWSEEVAKNVLILRCFNETDNKWKQFWDKIVKMGY